MNPCRLLVLFLSSFFIFSCQRTGIIFIDSDQIINESGYGTAKNWFDEPDTLCLPLTSWETPGTESYWPAGVIIDFGREVSIDHLAIFDGEKSGLNESGEWEHRAGEIRVSTGAPFEWSELKSLSLSNDQKWKRLAVNQNLRYLRLQKISTETYHWREFGPFLCDLNVGEIVVFGSPSGRIKADNPEAIIPKTSVARFPMEQFIGANSYKWIPEKINSAVGIIRDYHHWGSNGVLHLDSAYSWISRDGTTRMDEYFERIHLEKTFETFPDVHRHADPKLPGENKPAFGRDPAEPESYALIADYFFQFVARYGHNKVEPQRLRVKAGETQISGAGWLNYYECWNEPDRWWGVSEAHFTPYELAAMSSAAYDGHQKTMGENFGVKNADPEAKLVLGGLTSLDLQYMETMLLWAKHKRDGSFPADVINFHHYNNSAGKQHQAGKVVGISPEADSLKQRLEKLVRWRDTNLPGKEIWLSEFGWDTYESSSQAATGHSLYPKEVDMFYLQAIWLVRGYLVGAASGIDRMFMYLANDLGEDGLYRNCGLVYQDLSPKLSWYYVSTLKQVLTGTRFTEVVNQPREDIRVYRFQSDSSSREVLAIWCPTSDGTSLKDYSLKLPEGCRQVNLIEMSAGLKEGKSTALRAKQEVVKVNVSEQPVFVEYLLE